MNFENGSGTQLSDDSTREGLLLWNRVGNKLILLCMILVMTSVISPSTYADQHVLTMYFGGTGLPQDGWHEDHTRWGSPSLLATMYRNHVDDLATEHKVFVAGVGAPPDCGGNPKINILSDAFLQQAAPHGYPNCRTWADTVDEGIEKLRIVMGNLQADDTLTLNIVGHSRGAIATMWFFRRVIQEEDNPEEWITKINMIVLEPVPGMKLIKKKYTDVQKIAGSWDNFRLDSRLDKFVAIFSQDERAERFGALIPWVNDKHRTDSWMFRVRGSHQTIAGNLWVGGHAPTNFPSVCLYPYTDPSFCAFATPVPRLIDIHNLVAITLVELLSGLEWGLVDFRNDNGFLDDIYGTDNWKTEPTRNQAFLDLVTEMNDPVMNATYELMQITGFLTGNLWWWGPVIQIVNNPLGEFNGSECVRIKFEYTGLFTAWDLQSKLNRCVEKVLPVGSGHRMSSLEGSIDIPLIGGDPVIGGKPLTSAGAWDRIREMSKTDTDKDLVSDDMDNCPLTINPDQANVDGDEFGDVCDPDIDGDGVPNEEDNCRFRFNPGQEDDDIPPDGEGNICDDDIDGDGFINDEDMCPWHFDPLQLDSDSDGNGDACDNCPFTIDADEVDDDEDLVGDVCDNCLGLKNTSQTDSDNDGLGNACDICPFDVNPAQLDSDGDGNGDACDNCPYVADPTEADEDEDLIGDVCDNCPNTPNTDQADSDKDGKGDACDLDNDEDGVLDTADMCPNTPTLGEAVDPVLGCSLNQLVPCEGPFGTGLTWEGHDEYVQAMEIAVLDFKTKGLIDDTELAAIREAIQDNQCGRTWVESIPALGITGLLVLTLALFAAVGWRLNWLGLRHRHQT